jgi:predicted peptidase
LLQLPLSGAKATKGEMALSKNIFCAGSFLLLGWIGHVGAANVSDFVVYNYSSDNNLKGLLYNANPPAGQKYPLVIFFHGASETGNNAQVNGNIDALLNAAKGITQPQKFFLLAPQSTSGSWGGAAYNGNWSGEATDTVNKAMAMAAGVIRDYPVDTSRIYVTGLSAGGEGTWIAMAYYKGKILAAGVPLSAVVDLTRTTDVSANNPFPPGVISSFVGTPMWMFHSRNDNNVPFTTIDVPRKALDQIRAATPRPTVITWPLTSDQEGYQTPGNPYYNDAALGSPPGTASTLYSYNNFRYSEFNRGGHSNVSWALAYNEIPMYSWLFSNTSALLPPQPGDTILFDFGATATATTDDAQGRTWNCPILLPTVGHVPNVPVVPFAKNSAGVTRSVSLTISKLFNYTSSDGPTSGSPYPSNVSRDGWLAGDWVGNAQSANTPGEIRIGGLTPNATYQVTIFGATVVQYYNGTTNYTINGTMKSLMTAGNVTNKATFDSVTADSNGNFRISIAVAVNAGTNEVFGVINALEIAVPSGLETWRSNQFGVNAGTPSIAGNSADPDGDGLTNLVEYALSANPNAAASTNLPVCTAVSDHLQLAFSRMAPSDVTYVVEVSTNLISWTPIATFASGGVSWTGTATVNESGSGATRTVTVTDAATISGGPQRFLRLKVTSP